MLKREKLTYSDLFWMFVHHWQWFLLSVIICLCLAFLYTSYVTPVYEFTGKMLIKNPDGYRGERWKHRITMIRNLGTVSNTLGIENEVERIWSSLMFHDVVMQLKLYTEYKEEGRIKDKLLYANQPINVDLDPLHLDSLDKVAFDEMRIIALSMTKQDERDSTFHLKGALISDNETVLSFGGRVKQLPATVNTPYGTLTFTRNANGKMMEVGKCYKATIYPPLYKTLRNLGNFSVKQASKDYSTLRSVLRYYFKESSIVEMTYRDQNLRRGSDIVRQVELSYNRMAAADKDEIALRSEEFINGRLNRLAEELGVVDSSIENIKRKSGITSFSDAAQSVKGSDKFSSKLANAESQVMIIDELSSYVKDPSSRYEVIPTSIGLNDKTTERLIDKYNSLVQDRNRMLKSASQEAVHVKRLTATIDELHSALGNALQQARHSASVSMQGIAGQYNTYQGRVHNMPSSERVLRDVGREQLTKSRLYKILLKRREEMIIAQTSDASRVKLIDEPLCTGRVRPNLLLAYGIATGLGLVIPYAIIYLLSFFRYKLEGHKELASLTDIPIIADVPISKDSDKDKAGIVVRQDSNRMEDEVFRLMRTNLRFMVVQGSTPVILFTSTTSGEGKTFNAANLAVSYALLGKKVVLCGLDIRKPALGKLFDLRDKERGISTLLSMEDVKKADVISRIQPSGVNKCLDLLLAGPIPPNPTELLTHDSFRQVLAILKETYDCVILDTAPVGLVTDTLQFSALADVTVFVCRVDYTPIYAIDQLNGLVENKKLLNPCIVLNGCKDNSFIGSPDYLMP